jgi:hypothetical protein
MIGKKKKPQGWQVQLGEVNWRRFTNERPPSEGLQLLGSVQRGAQKGALAVSNDGQLYYQINGDYLTPLSPAQLKRAVQIAAAELPSGSGARASGTWAAAHSDSSWLKSSPAPNSRSNNAPPPVVVVKKRRVVVQTD